MDDTVKGFKSKLPRPAKDIFEDFIYSSKSLDFFPPLTKTFEKSKAITISFNDSVISVLRYIFYVMYRNRVDRKCMKEMCHLSYETIARYSRTSIPTVKRVIPYAISLGLLISIDEKEKSKLKLIAGEKIHEFYPQN